ncbi:MAG: hypothetical protein RLZZ398_2202, partial [Verrucomicrobiota bacterium]
MFDSSLLNEAPGLSEWISADKWRSHFSSTTLLQSKPYASERFIKQVEFAYDSENHQIFVEAIVHGTSPEPYLADILFSQQRGLWSAEPECSCPVGASCKHAAALLSLISSQLAKNGGNGLASSLTISTPQFAPELREWLREIENAAETSSPKPAASAAKPENRFLAYCLEQPLYQRGSTLNFVMRVGTRQKDGSVLISESRANADPS